MSLFGGDSSAPPTESEYESGSDNSASPIARSPPSTGLGSPPSAQQSQSLPGIPEVGAEGAAEDLAGNDADSEESDDEEPERPNKFKGPSRTWNGYTAADRQIVESLQQIEDNDLAAHLYNAHALKRRARRPTTDLSTTHGWQNKDVWLKEVKDLQYEDAAGQLQTELVPAKDWTAWPLPPPSLHSLRNGFRWTTAAAEEDEWAIGGSGVHNPGEELKDEMLGLFLRLAKDNWTAKEWQDDGQRSSKNSARLVKNLQPQIVHSDVEMKDDMAFESPNDEGEEAQKDGVKRGRKSQVELDIKPAILADDDKAQKLLRPTIASILNQIDDVALALQRTRHNHFGHGGFDDWSSQSEFTTDAETTERESISRSQSRATHAPRSKPMTLQALRLSSSRASRAPKSPKKPLKPTADLEDSDSTSDYGAQFAKDDALDSAASRSPTVHRKRSRSESTADENDMSNTRDWTRAGLMDWSEVLGVAAVKGWDQKVLARTAERCAALFGESMSFMPFHEDLATESKTELVQYTPATHPAPDTSIAGATRPTKRPYWQAGTLRCPHADCDGYHKDFRWSHRVIEHCLRVHGYDPRTNNSDNEEREYGGVHIDGFLQPIAAKQGWLGRGRSKAGGKKRKTGKSDAADAMKVEGFEEEAI
ncbi:hypothetical protein C7974DRAFT_231204 [Boeremia exigua]|uniref:uncharacterized protein n=1 Tax=Boeremia exigua TaxID=749465 RepID=UPI001E8D6968|nr:uncharacterized protein C7974DRAFT_231204 [Boeremia exigua]KAH6620331.1 hypothetical protein C7974DRAFT_231204 [Boeremia exigua]